MSRMNHDNLNENPMTIKFYHIIHVKFNLCGTLIWFNLIM